MLKYSFKRNFITGLFTLLPLFLTVLILYLFTSFVYDKLKYIPQLIFPNNKLAVIAFAIIIFFLIIVFVSYVGFLVTHLVGRNFLKKANDIVKKIPLISKIYIAIKQLIDSFSLKGRKAFQRVVLLEYPWKGMLSIGFVMGEVHIKSKGNFLKIFIMKVPNPTSGFLVFAKKDQVINTDISIEEGIKFVVSGGIVAPKNL